MKILRLILMALALPAVTLLSLNHLGGTPLSKGYDTGFNVAMVNSPGPTLIISTDAGDLNCWLRLKVTAAASSFSARLSSGDSLSIYQEGLQGSHQWVAIVAPGEKRQEKFKWPTGVSLFVNSNDNMVANLTPSDWQIFMSDKAYDSKDRASWRSKLFYLSIILLMLAITGGTLEGFSRFKEVKRTFTAQTCVEELINATQGQNGQETKWMKTLLSMILLQGVSPTNALQSIPLKGIKGKMFWFRTRDQFRSRLKRLIENLKRNLGYLEP